MQHLVEQAVVLAHRLGGRSGLFEFRDVGTRGESRDPCPAERDAAHFGIGVELLYRRRDAAPHRAVDGVAPLRLVENDPAHGAALFHAQSHGFPDGP